VEDNADLAAGASTVIVLNVLAHLVPADPLTAELAALGAASTLVISPDEAAAAAMGAQLMDPAVAAPALAAALAQAASCADTPSKPWTALCYVGPSQNCPLHSDARKRPHSAAAEFA